MCRGNNTSAEGAGSDSDEDGDARGSGVSRGGHQCKSKRCRRGDQHCAEGDGLRRRGTHSRFEIACRCIAATNWLDGRRAGFGGSKRQARSEGTRF